eukprot:s1371_g13.t1
MGVMVPDPALILRGVDSLVDPLSRKASNAQVAFRLSVARNQLEIDHRPSMASVIEYMRVLQSEWEQVSVSGQEAASGQPKVARMETDQGNGGKDGDKGDKGGKGTKGDAKKGEKGDTMPKAGGGGKGTKGDAKKGEKGDTMPKAGGGSGRIARIYGYEQATPPRCGQSSDRDPSTVFRE